jgi:hypothetical protein
LRGEYCRSGRQECERQTVRRINCFAGGELMSKTIMLVHGAWVTTDCWADFRKFFEDRGHKLLIGGAMAGSLDA